MKDLFFATILPGDIELGLSALSGQQVDDFLSKNKRNIDWDRWFSIIENTSNEVFSSNFKDLNQHERMISISKAQRKNFRLATDVIVSCLETYYTNPDVLVAIGALPAWKYEQSQIKDEDNWDIVASVVRRGQIYRDVH